MTTGEALEIILSLARDKAKTQIDINACSIVEDLIVNHFGEGEESLVETILPDNFYQRFLFSRR